MCSRHAAHPRRTTGGAHMGLRGRRGAVIAISPRQPPRSPARRRLPSPTREEPHHGPAQKGRHGSGRRRHRRFARNRTGGGPALRPPGCPARARRARRDRPRRGRRGMPPPRGRGAHPLDRPRHPRRTGTGGGCHGRPLRTDRRVGGVGVGLLLRFGRGHPRRGARSGDRDEPPRTHARRPRRAAVLARGRGGTIVFVGSLYSQVAGPYVSSYSPRSTVCSASRARCGRRCSRTAASG